MDAKQFPEITLEELKETLSLTIRKDDLAKVVSFIILSSAYTQDSQLNGFFNSPSASGKTYIPLEVAKLFPAEDVKTFGYCSPTSFFHDAGEWDRIQKQYRIDWSNRILIFLDQPHSELLARLRPLLSHDQREITFRITDRTEKFGLRTKSVVIHGFPAVIFCTCGFTLDEQEATRVLLLSPEMDGEKIRQAVRQKIKTRSDPERFAKELEANQARQELKARLRAIREIRPRVKIHDDELLERQFFLHTKFLKPRSSRDIERVASIAITWATLNFWTREKLGDDSILTNQVDFDVAFGLWAEIAETQELGISPFLVDLYRKVIVAAWPARKNPTGLERSAVVKRYFEVYHSPLPMWKLIREILPSLESAGLVALEPDPGDKRRTLVRPLTIVEPFMGMGMRMGEVAQKKPPTDKETELTEEERQRNQEAALPYIRKLASGDFGLDDFGLDTAIDASGQDIEKNRCKSSVGGDNGQGQKNENENKNENKIEPQPKNRKHLSVGGLKEKSLDNTPHSAVLSISNDTSPTLEFYISDNKIRLLQEKEAQLMTPRVIKWLSRRYERLWLLEAKRSLEEAQNTGDEKALELAIAQYEELLDKIQRTLREEGVL